jgi:hypothetical protein
MSFEEPYLADLRDQFARCLEDALSQVPDEDLQAIDPESNSITIIVKHLAGNMRSRWTDFLASDGEKPNRHRDDEFVVGPQTTRAEVMRGWEDGWRVTLGAIEPLGPDLGTVRIRGTARLRGLARSSGTTASTLGRSSSSRSTCVQASGGR